jgi:hypothetical protein
MHSMCSSYCYGYHRKTKAMLDKHVQSSTAQSRHKRSCRMVGLQRHTAAPLTMVATKGEVPHNGKFSTAMAELAQSSNEMQLRNARTSKGATAL